MVKFANAVLCIAFLICSGQSPVEAQDLTGILGQVQAALSYLTELLTRTTISTANFTASATQSQEALITNLTNSVNSALAQATAIANGIGSNATSCSTQLNNTLASINATIPTLVSACTNNATATVQSQSKALLDEISTITNNLNNTVSLIDGCPSDPLNVQYAICLTQALASSTANINAMTTFVTDNFTNGVPNFIINATDMLTKCQKDVINQVNSQITTAVNDFNTCTSNATTTAST